MRQSRLSILLLAMPAAQQRAGIGPAVRLNGRVRNRARAQVRSRIGRSRDPQANAALRFPAAAEPMGSAPRPQC